MAIYRLGALDEQPFLRRPVASAWVIAAVNVSVAVPTGPIKIQKNDYLGIVSGLHMTWPIAERQRLVFAWEIFNVSNSLRLDTNPATFQNSFNEGTLWYLWSKIDSAPD